MLALFGCGQSEPPSFEGWLTEAVSRCTPGAEVSAHCDPGPCIGIVRTPSGEEIDPKGCMNWPYNGMGTQKRTQECAGVSWRLTALSQLPELDQATAKDTLQLEATRVAATLDAVQCPASE